MSTVEISILANGFSELGVKKIRLTGGEPTVRKDFCKTCNRLRITTIGDLRLCLFGNTGTSIRHLLQGDNQKEELVDLIISQLRLKKESHHSELGDIGITPTYHAQVNNE
jgi:molybdenum cofactor biosynthesis enzyme MoaA